MTTRTEKKQLNRARAFAFQPIIWLSSAVAACIVIAVFFWNLGIPAGAMISSAIAMFFFIKLKGSFYYVKNRAKMYDIFTKAIRNLGYPAVAPQLAKYMNTICARYIARMILSDTGNKHNYKTLLAAARMENMKKKSLDKSLNIVN
jgi:hypothetical protein